MNTPLPMTRLYLLLALCSCLFVLYCVVISWHAGPFRDLWVDFDVLRPLLEGEGHFRDLFALHGGAHRLAVPRLFFLAEYRFFAGTNIFLMSVSALAQASVVLLVWKLLREEQHLAYEQRLFLLAMTVLLLFNATQLENFLYTFDMQWFLTAAAAAWALAGWVALTQDAAEAKPILKERWLFCIGMTAISAFSSFSGVCVLLILPLIVFLLRAPLRISMAIMLCAVTSIALYTQGIFGGGATAWIGIKEAAPSLWNYLEFYYWIFVLLGKWIILYLGSPLSRYSVLAAGVMVTASILLVVWYSLKVLRHGKGSLTQFQLTCLAWCGFAFAVAAVTGWGRMYFINTANEDRYQTIAALYWLGFFGFAVSRTAQFPDRLRRLVAAPVVAMVLAWTLCLLPVAGWRDANAQVGFFDRVNTTNMAIAVGQWEFSHIRDTLILGDKVKKINRPEMHAGWLQENRWGMFATREARLLGTSIDLMRVSADACEGSILSQEVIGTSGRAYRMTGQAEDVIDERLPQRFVAITPEGVVVGLGRLQRDKTTLWPSSWQVPELARWIVFTRDLAPGVLPEILAERPSGGYCRVGSGKKPVE